jgi:hypothetical protein
LKICKEKVEKSHYHLAMNGKSFGVIRNEHADLLEKVIFEPLKKTNTF